MTAKKNIPTWGNVKAKLSDFDRNSLLDLVQNLYAASKDNQTFLHARFGLGGDILKPYKTTIERYLWPDVFKQQDTSVAKAKKAIADYKKALGHPDALAELMVFYCERAVGFIHDVGLDNEGYYDALINMFEQTLKLLSNFSEPQRAPYLSRLNALRSISHDFGYGVGDNLDDLMLSYGFDA
jgi:hypothetical protein